jgi:uncharacterized protein
VTAPPTRPRTTLTRLRERQRTDRGELDALLDSVLVGHFGFVDAGAPVVLPTAIARDGDWVLAHGSTGSRWMRSLEAGAPTCLTVTALDALVVARSAFESSMHYRSAVLFGTCTAVADDDKRAAVDVITEKLLPGRTAEIRRPTDKELRATMVLRLPIGDWSLKVAHNWPDDPPEDVAGDAWAGIVPLLTTRGEPVPAPDLRAGIALPASLR